MEITVYAKKRTASDGKFFYSYLATLTRKDGTKQIVSVKFREECGKPKPENCPINIKFEKSEANIATRQFVREDNGEAMTCYTLWVSAWEPGKPFVDNSLDDFE